MQSAVLFMMFIVRWAVDSWKRFIKNACKKSYNSDCMVPAKMKPLNSAILGPIIDRRQL